MGMRPEKVKTHNLVAEFLLGFSGG